MNKKEHRSYFPEECLLREIAGQPKLSIGIPKENSQIETRLPLTPEGVAIVTEEGHSVYVEKGAGISMSYSDLQYSEAGAYLVDSHEEVFSCDIIFKIAPPSLSEIEMMNENASILSLLQVSNLSADCIHLMMKKKITAIAYEMIRDEQKTFPVVSSIAEVEGNTTISLISELMSTEHGGKGILLGGVAGIPPSEIVIFGASISGQVAAKVAVSQGAIVKVFDHDINKLRKIQQNIGQNIFTSVIHPTVLFKSLATADAVIGNLRYINNTERFMVSEELVKTMKNGAIIVDLSVDQGGCFETSECRTLHDPLYIKHGIKHYCVPNISARVARTSSMVLSNIFAPIILKIGESGSINKAISESSGFRNGVYVYNGILVNRLIGNYYNIPYNEISLLIVGY